MAPPQADHPMDKFLGCQITNTKVAKNIMHANKINVLNLHYITL
jgi:hypothetical protein